MLSESRWVTSSPRWRASPTSAAMSAYVGCGCAVSAPASVLAQHSEHVAELVEGVVGLALDRGEALAQATRVEVRAEGHGTRLHGDLGDPVGEHVVHLAGDLGAFGGARLQDPQLLLVLGPFGAGPQRPEQLATGSEVHPPAHHPGVDGEVDQRGDGEAVDLEGGNGRGVELRRCEVGEADDDDLPRSAQRRHGNRSQRGRARGDAGEGAHRRNHQRDPHRRPAPEEDQDVGEESQDQLGREQQPVVLRLGDGHALPHRDGDHQAHGVPPRMGRPRQRGTRRRQVGAGVHRGRLTVRLLLWSDRKPTLRPMPRPPNCGILGARARSRTGVTGPDTVTGSL